MPITTPSRATTAPTSGFGLVLASPRRARSKVRPRKRRSSGVTERPSRRAFGGGLSHERGYEGARVEVEEVVHSLADADVADRDLQLARDRQRDPSARGPVQLRDDQPGHGGGARELSRLREPVLSGRRV